MDIEGFGTLIDPEETVYLANVHGAIAFYGEDPGDGGERPIVGGLGLAREGGDPGPAEDEAARLNRARSARPARGQA